MYPPWFNNFVQASSGSCLSHGHWSPFPASQKCFVETFYAFPFVDLKVPPKVIFAKLKAKEPATAAMSKSEIQSWLSSASTGTNENGDRDEQVWQRDRVLNDWPQSMEYAQKVLLTQKTKARIEFLQNEILSLAKHGGSTMFNHPETENDI